jgi:hypothetical protein
VGNQPPCETALMQRRTLLKLGVASSAVLLVAGGAAALLQPGLDGSRLSAAGREVFGAVGRTVLDQTLPHEEGPRQIALGGLLNRIDALIAALPPHAQAELSQLLALMASGAGRRAFAGLSEPWSSAPIPLITDALQGMRLSSLAMRQQAYAALHDITAGAWFSDATTWSMLGYPGPLAIQ